MCICQGVHTRSRVGTGTARAELAMCVCGTPLLGSKRLMAISRISSNDTKTTNLTLEEALKLVHSSAGQQWRVLKGKRLLCTV